MNQRVLVCGGRDYVNRKTVFSVLDLAHEANPIVLLIHGGARGADSLAGAWAISRQIPLRVFAADWELYGKSAGPIRNKQMLDESVPDLVIAFPGGRGTANMVSQALAAGVPVTTVVQNDR